jgi:hypothetical protein
MSILCAIAADLRPIVPQSTSPITDSRFRSFNTIQETLTVGAHGGAAPHSEYARDRYSAASPGALRFLNSLKSSQANGGLGDEKGVMSGQVNRTRQW